MDLKSDGEKIYLVPLFNPSKERVDSTIIANGKFMFEEDIDSTEIFILRTKPELRLHLQELLVVKEPGCLVVKIGSVSIASGTPLNDSLQRWKENKMIFDVALSELRRNYQASDSVEQARIKQQSDSISARNLEFHFNFVKNNYDNVVGKMVYRMVSSAFTEEQKRQLDAHIE